MITITDWASDGTQRENDKDIMYLVSADEEITFSITTDESCDYVWEINKVEQGINANTISFIIPNGKSIWEIHVKASNANGEAHHEWVVSTLGIYEAPDFFDYFTDKKYSNRTETDPWGRTLPEWTADYGSILVSKGFLESAPQTGVMHAHSAISYGTWKFRFQFPDGRQSMAGGANYLECNFLHVSDNNRYHWEMACDSHHHCTINYPNTGGMKVSMEYDASIFPDKNWHTVTIVKTEDGWIYVYYDDLLDFRYHSEDNITSNNIQVIMRRYKASQYPDDLMRIGDFEIYENKYLFPKTSIAYETYIDRYSADQMMDDGGFQIYNRTGIVINGRNVTLSEINNAINDPTKFKYEPSQNAYICYTDFVVGDGAELNINNETLKFHCNYDGEHQLAVMFGATLCTENSTITSDNNYYWMWRLSSTTHFGYPACLIKSTPSIHGGNIEYTSTQSIIIDNSVIDNSAYMFFDQPYELRIKNSEISNLNAADVDYLCPTGCMGAVKNRQDYSRK